MKYLLMCAFLITSSAFAETVISATNSSQSISSGIGFDSYGGSVSSGTIAIDSYGSVSGSNAYKKVLASVQPDALAVLEGEEATPLFLEALEMMEKANGIQFETELDAALAMMEAVNK